MSVIATELSAELPCVRCGYDLRGHNTSGRCPECGLDAYWTLRAPQKLSEYPAGWVRAMSWGTRLLALTYAELFLFLLLGFTGWFDGSNNAPVIGFLFAAVFQLPGMWLLSRHSGHLRERRAPINRWLLRITPLGMLIGSLAGGAVLIHYDPALEIALLAGFVVAGIAPTVAFIRLRAVARLIADATLAEYSAIVGWGFLIVCAALGSFAYLLDPHSTNDKVGLALVAIIAASLLLFLLWGAFILVCCVLDFGRAAKIAQAQWNSDAPPVSSEEHGRA